MILPVKHFLRPCPEIPVHRPAPSREPCRCFHPPLISPSFSLIPSPYPRSLPDWTPLSHQKSICLTHPWLMRGSVSMGGGERGSDSCLIWLQIKPGNVLFFLCYLFLLISHCHHTSLLISSHGLIMYFNHSAHYWELLKSLYLIACGSDTTHWINEPSGIIGFIHPNRTSQLY